MKKLVVAGVLVCVAMLAFAQQSINTKDLDLSKAIVTMAGPDSVYVRNIYYQGTQLSVILKYNGKDGAEIYGPYYNADKLMADSDQLGYAKLSIEGNDTIQVSNLIIGGQGYSGTMKYDGVYTLNVTNYYPSPAPETYPQQIADLQNQNAALNREVNLAVDMYTKKLDTANKSLTDTQKQLAQAKKDLAAATAGTAGLSQVQKGQYEQQIADLQNQLNTANTQLAAAKAAPAQAAAAPALPTNSILSGISGGTSVLGTWNVSGGTATQTSSSQFFAKYAIPLTQNQNQVLYSFTAKSSGSGFVGLGLHFFASGATTGNGYGYGTSYLVWLTRDPQVYQTNATFVQLYQSNNDTQMVQLASSAISSSIASSNNVQVLYDRSAGMISVWVNGNKMIDFAVSSPIASGTNVVLRALGAGAQFSNLSVKAK